MRLNDTLKSDHYPHGVEPSPRFLIFLIYDATTATTVALDQIVRNGDSNLPVVGLVSVLGMVMNAIE
ncbi:hypothetical protein GWI33_009350 [Rhynchophorus ferrugineus]|uniref:Uncharacterized protein n=1 Tax=Rhynchophorus ferrugineus TaxID=354439 RepID=A0A834IFK8_RHYFE|nr:hypothetical protein GWI33_009350 [Rhynchophorus ferrugineus]